MAETKPNLGHKISTFPLYYFPVSMVLLMIGAVTIIILVRENIAENFQTNIPLNSVIFFVVIAACFKAFKNNYDLLRVARFVKRIESIESQSDVYPEDIQNLTKGLESQGQLIDMHNMKMALEKMANYGHFIINDKDAMLIKSKLGGRVRNERNIVAYLGGTLVMLGLIGTFWGLLITIASVGEAMGEVSKGMSAGSSGEGMANMGEFIEGIAKPLQGMGIAFSSSLFGLTGSLFLGMLNFFGGHAQNRFMEDMARWIDLHIPALNPKLAQKTKDMNVPGSDDLKSWLAAFVHLSNKTNRRLSVTYSAMSQLINHIGKSVSGNNEMIGYQRDMKGSLLEMNESLKNTQSILRDASQATKPLLAVQETVSKNLEIVSHRFEENRQHISNVSNSQTELGNKITDMLSQMNQLTSELNGIHGQVKAQLTRSAESDQNFDAKYDAKYNELSQLSLQISKVLEEVDQNNQTMENIVFSKPTTPDGVDNQ